MKGNKSECRGNDQHHFLDGGNKAESLSDLLNVSEARAAREVPREAAVLSTQWLCPRSPAPLVEDAAVPQPALPKAAEGGRTTEMRPVYQQSQWEELPFASHS